MASETLNLEGLSMEDLRMVQKQVEQHMTTKDREARDAAKRQIKEIAQQAGVKVTIEGEGRGPKGVVKFRGPDGETWTGRGKRPGFVRDHLVGGGSLDDLLVPR